MEETIKKDKSKAHKEFQTLMEQDLALRSFRENEIVEGTVEEISKKFVFIDVKGKSSGSVPIEEYKAHSKGMDINIGDKTQVLIQRLEHPKNGEIVISRELAVRHKSWKKIEQLYANKELCSGYLTGKVKGGYAISINSVLCFCPSSQLDVRPIKNIDGLKKTPLKFKIEKIDQRRKNIVVSRRSVLEMERNAGKEKILANLKEKMIVTGVCKNILQWGAFIDLQGVDALLHVTDASHFRINSMKDIMNVGDEIRCMITKIDEDTKKISVSIKALTESPWLKMVDDYKPGTIHDAVVTRVVEYGAFAKMGDLIEGLIHSSELHYVRKNVHPNKILSVSQKIKVYVMEVDKEKKRIGLSYKRAMGENPWETFAKKVKPKDILSGVVKAVSDYGLFISINYSDGQPSQLEGLCHWKNLDFDCTESELSKWKKGMSCKFAVLEYSVEQEKIQLSIKHTKPDNFALSFEDKAVGDTITVTVQGTDQNGIYVSAGKKNFPVMIKKNQLSQEISNQRISRFIKGDRCDVLITELELSKRKISVSIKALEKKIMDERVKKWGKEKAGTGAVLGDILGPILNKKKKK